MICELYNKIVRYNGYLIGAATWKETEVSLLMFIFMLVIAIFFTVTLAWWMIPLRSIKFRCDKK